MTPFLPVLSGGPMRHVLLLALLTLLLPAPARADIWKKVDEKGVVHFTNRPKGNGWVLFMRTRPPSRPGRSRNSGTWKHYEANKARYAPIIERTARRYGLNANLVHAVVRAESAYNAEAESHKGAVGLMQLMPGTARRYGVGNRRDPVQNVSAGVRYLRDLLLQFRQLPLALAAYNAGEGAVARYGNTIPPYPETQAYVKKVIRFYRELGGQS